jgi:tetratricopeptide (TPR) repeat protein
MQHLLPQRFVPVILVCLLGMSVFGVAGCQSKPQLTHQERLQQAEEHLKSGQFHKALVELRQILKHDPQNIQVHVDLAWVYLYTDDMEKALEELQIIHELDSEYDKAYYLKGAIYHRLEQWEDALENYNEALKSDINNPELHYDIANVFLKLNFPDAALKEFDVALKLSPETSAYQFGRCMAFRQMKQYNDAIGACEQAIASSLDQEKKEHERIQEVIEGIKLLQIIDSGSPKEKNQSLDEE